MAFLYLFWILLNGVLLLGLMASWFRCLQLFARQYSRSASIALCVVTVMTCTSSNESAFAPGRVTTVASVYLPLKRPVRYDHQLLDFPMASLSQDIRLSPSGKPGDSLQIDHTVSLTGLQTGLHWKPVDISVSPQPGRQIRYDVVGILEWRLLNLTIYKQSVQYTGLVAVDTLPSRQ